MLACQGPLFPRLLSTAAAVRSPLDIAPWMEAVSRWPPHTSRARRSAKRCLG
jgi:hypothetical protein